MMSNSVSTSSMLFFNWTPCAEYATVGYMAKRIQMRKNRFLALQKMAEQKKSEAMNASNAALTALGNGGPDGHGMPKQTVWSSSVTSTKSTIMHIILLLGRERSFANMTLKNFLSLSSAADQMYSHIKSLQQSLWGGHLDEQN